MILVLSGLHGAGKSHLRDRIVAEFGWEAFVKRDLLKLHHARAGTGGDWVAWYRALYATEGAYEVTRKLLDLVSSGDRIILDSVHNLSEWRAVRDLRPDAVLTSVIAPKAVRVARNGPEDPKYDAQRIRFWHDEGEDRSCLVAESDWCFNGAASDDVQQAEFEAFLSHYAMS